MITAIVLEKIKKSEFTLFFSHHVEKLHTSVNILINLFLDEDVLSSRVAHKKEREFFRKNCDDISCGI